MQLRLREQSERVDIPQIEKGINLEIFFQNGLWIEN